MSSSYQSQHRSKNFQSHHPRGQQAQFVRQPSQEDANSNQGGNQNPITFVVPSGDKNMRPATPHSGMRQYQHNQRQSIPTIGQQWIFPPGVVMAGQQNIQNPMLTAVNAQLAGPFPQPNQPPLYVYQFNGAGGQPTPSVQGGVPRQPLLTTQGYYATPTGPGVPQNQVLAYPSNGTSGPPVGGVPAYSQNPQFLPQQQPVSYAQTTYQQAAAPMAPAVVTGAQQPPPPSVTPSSVMAPPFIPAGSTGAVVGGPGTVGTHYQPQKREKKIIKIEDPNTSEVINKEDVDKYERLQEETNHRPPSSGGSGRTPSPNAPSTVTPDTQLPPDRGILTHQIEAHTVRTEYETEENRMIEPEIRETEAAQVIAAAVPPPISRQVDEETAVPSPSTKVKNDFMNAVLLASVGPDAKPELPPQFSFGDFPVNLDDSKGEEEMKMMEASSGQEEITPPPQPEAPITVPSSEKDIAPEDSQEATLEAQQENEPGDQLEVEAESLTERKPSEETVEDVQKIHSEPETLVSEQEENTVSEVDVESREFEEKVVSGESETLVNEAEAPSPVELNGEVAGLDAPSPTSEIQSPIPEAQVSQEELPTVQVPPENAKLKEFESLQEQLRPLEEDRKGVAVYSKQHLAILKQLVELADYSSEAIKEAANIPALAEVCCGPGNRGPRDIGDGGGQRGPSRFDAKRSGMGGFMLPWQTQMQQGPPHQIPGRQSYQGRHSQSKRRPPQQPQQQVIVLRSSIGTGDVQLTHRTDNAWQPTAKKTPEELTPAQSLQKKARGILNKIAPTTFKELMEEFLLLPIDSEDHWTAVIDVIFDKAVEEPAFCEIYSQLCKTVVDKELSETARQSTEKGKSQFRNLLLGKCQRFFEEDSKEQTSTDELKKQMETAEGKEKEKLGEELVAKERKKKRRKLGNIRFIGELYKNDLLIAKIMHYCVMQLFNDGDEESIESLCKLLTTVGQKLEDSDKMANQAAQSNLYYPRLEELSKDSTARIRFMIMDLIDLRKDNWRPRIASTGPKTKAEIHAEIRVERAEQQIKLEDFKQQERKMSLQMAGGGRQQGAQMRKATVPGRPSWQGSQDKRGGQTDRRRDPAAAAQAAAQAGPPERRGPTTLSKHLDETNMGRPMVQWGMGRGTKGSWAQGATGGAKDQKKGLGRDGSRGGGSDSSRDSSQTRIQDKAGKERALMAVRQILTTESQNRTPPLTSPEPEPQPAEAEDAEVVEEKLVRYSKEMLDELVSNKDINEAAHVMEDKAVQAGRILHHCFFHCMEKHAHHRLWLGKLIDMVVMRGSVKKQDVLNSLGSFVGSCIDQDYTEDVPKLWEYLGEILGKLLCLSRMSNLFDLRDFSGLMRQAGRNGKDILAHTLLAVRADQDGGQERFKEVMRVLNSWDFGVDPQELAGKHEVLRDFLLVDPTEPTEDGGRGGVGTESDLELAVESERMLKENPESLLESPLINNPDFPSALMKAVFKVCITGVEEDCHLDEDKFEGVHRVLLRVVAGQKDAEKMLLNEAKLACEAKQYPSGLMEEILRACAENILVSSESFLEWRSENEKKANFGMVFNDRGIKIFFNELK